MPEYIATVQLWALDDNEARAALEILTDQSFEDGPEASVSYTQLFRRENFTVSGLEVA